MERVKRKAVAGLKSKKRIILLAIVNAVLLASIAISLVYVHEHTHVLVSQQTAKYWKGQSEEAYAQVSAFMPVDSPSSLETVYTFRSGLDEKIEDSGIELPEEGSLWVDAYSGMGEATVTGAKGKADATVIGVGGSFFTFHQYELLSGSYISENDFMLDRVILDYDLAWKIFGSPDLEGMTVEIGGLPYYVAGVIKREGDKFTEKTLTDDPIIFMDYTTALNSKIVSGVSCYELAMPDPITNFAQNLVTDTFNKSAPANPDALEAKPKADIVQNSSRYSFGSIYSIFKDFGSRSVIDGGMNYPYWENAARVSEVFVARLYVIIALLAIIPFLSLVWLAVLLIKYLTVRLRRGRAYAREAWDDRYARIEDAKTKREERKHRPRSEKGSLRQRLLQRRKKFAPEDNAVLDTPETDAPVYDEKAVSLDVEKIVREILDEKQ